MKYHSVAQARHLPGLRLALTSATPGPWTLSARMLFQLRRVPFIPVEQYVMQANEELRAWTGRRNAPVAVWNDEAPVDGWLEIANLAERLGGEIGEGPSLFPDDPVDRALAVGFSAEICGSGGFGWSRRLAMAGGSQARAGQSDDPTAAEIVRDYGFAGIDHSAAVARVASIMRGLAAQLQRQAAAGSPWLVGDRLSLCDVHWACFSQLVAPLSPQDCPVQAGLRMMFAALSPEIAAALDPVLIAHRDRVWRDHIGLPLDYLPE